MELYDVCVKWERGLVGRVVGLHVVVKFDGSEPGIEVSGTGEARVIGEVSVRRGRGKRFEDGAAVVDFYGAVGVGVGSAAQE